MKIAMISTPFETTPPVTYGGTGRIVSMLTEELVRRGHEVTLFATGDSVTTAKLVSRLDKPVKPHDAYVTLLHTIWALNEAKSGGYDIIHNHNWNFAAMAMISSVPYITTLHNDNAEFLNHPVFYTQPNLNLVGISDSQCQIMANRNIQVKHRIYNAIPVEQFSYSEKPGEYLVFLGNLTPQKGAHHAVQVAQKLGMPLKMAGRIADEPEFFEAQIKPYIDGKQIEYLGELNDDDKIQLLKGGYATLVPINWDEPFGLVMIESMACGTPVIGYNCASVPEIVKDQVTGFVVPDLEGMIAAVKQIDQIDRKACREHVITNFDVPRMADDYINLYRSFEFQNYRAVSNHF